MAFHYVKDSFEAEDIVQDIFAKIIANTPREISNFKAYVFTAVRNESLKRIQRKKPVDSLDASIIQLPTRQMSREDEMLEEERNSIVHKVIKQLPGKCREIFLLCIFEELKYQEVADKLGISINTVKAQMKKAYKILRTSANEDIFLFMLKLIDKK